MPNEALNAVMLGGAVACGGLGARPDAYASARLSIQRSDWATGVNAFNDVASTGACATPLDKLLYEIALVWLADGDLSAPPFTSTLIREANGELAMRRYLISPLVRAGRLNEGAAALERLVEAYPDLTDIRKKLASILARLECWDKAIWHADMAARSSLGDLSAQVDRVRFRLMARRNDEAGEIAAEVRPLLSPTSVEAHLIITALLRGGRIKDAAELAATMDANNFASSDVAASVTHALLLAGKTKQAIAAGEAAISAGHDSVALRAHIGEGILISGRPRDIASRALDHLTAGAALSPSDKRVNALLGEALLRSNRNEEAVSYLEKALATESKSPKTRGLYARALRAVGRHSESADEYLKLVKQSPERWATHRQAAGVLSQAGRTEEAATVFNTMVSTREALLPSSFEAAFADLPNRLHQANIPQARLDWAWKLRLNQGDVEREEWERRARWGMLADLLFLDWLECREHQAEEAMAVLADIGHAQQLLETARAGGRGLLLATAHVGPLFSAPVLLELCGIPHRWVASTPSIGDAHYASSVISTSDHTDMQVAKTCFRSLQSGYTVSIAVDGSGKPGAPTTRFEGQDISYSAFASRVVQKAGVPSLFVAPRWEKARIAFTVEPLPSPAPDEEVATFVLRWRDAYLNCLRRHLGGPPENLRLAGGLWSCIRPDY